MDPSRTSFIYPHSSSSGRSLRQTRGPPPSPSPEVPDVTEPNTGLEWFEMAASPGPSCSDHGVPRSPLVLASPNTQNSPLCNFAVPSTPVRDTLKFPLDLKKEFGRQASNSTASPLVQTVPTFGEQEPFGERKYSFKSGAKPSLEISEENGVEEQKTVS